MSHWRNHGVLAVLVAAFVALGFGVSAVQASVMGVKMALAADMNHAGDKACASCDDDDGSTASCSDFCVVSAFAALPVHSVMVALNTAGPFAPSQDLPRDGPSSSDPYPPKSSSIS